MWNKLEQAAAQWPLWVATVTGRMGQRVPHGFPLLDPAIQVFERKPKAPASEDEGEAPAPAE